MLRGDSGNHSLSFDICSLTLNKLQQKRMLEERLAKKRSQQLEKLQKKQQQETKVIKTSEVINTRTIPIIYSIIICLSVIDRIQNQSPNSESKHQTVLQ